MLTNEDDNIVESKSDDFISDLGADAPFLAQLLDLLGCRIRDAVQLGSRRDGEALKIVLGHCLLQKL